MKKKQELFTSGDIMYIGVMLTVGMFVIAGIYDAMTFIILFIAYLIVLAVVLLIRSRRKNKVKRTY